MSLVGESVLLIALLTAGALILLFLSTRAEQEAPVSEGEDDDVDGGAEAAER